MNTNDDDAIVNSMQLFLTRFIFLFLLECVNLKKKRIVHYVKTYITKDKGEDKNGNMIE
jgi:hypothetical protein